MTGSDSIMQRAVSYTHLHKDDAGTKPKRPCVAARRSRCKGSKRSAKLSRSHSGCAGCVCGTRRYGGLPDRDAKDAGICGTMLCSDVNEPDSGAADKQVYRGQRNRVCAVSYTHLDVYKRQHPNGGAFSDADLISTAMDRQSSAIVASGKKYDYIFKKGTHFKSNSFVKAVKTATMSGKDYDTAVNNWLKKNQKKYGYKYSRVKR